MKNLVDKLDKTAKTLGALNTQLEALYHTIDLVENNKDKEQLLYVYKQVYDSMGKHVSSIVDLVEVVKDRSSKK